MLARVRAHKGYFFLGLIAIWYTLSKLFLMQLAQSVEIAPQVPFLSISLIQFDFS